MKQILKAVLILLLVLAILGTGVWFFFIRRSDLTQSALSYWGDHYFEKGRYNRAVFFYDKAVKLLPDDLWANLRLAESYEKDHNASKAEYTLVNAITKIPDSVQLYAALSRVYLSQDKLLDAEQMLGRISNEKARAEIDALRPAAPVLSPESGTYSEYIDVSVSAASGTVYAALNTDYPSLASDAYTEPFHLPGGMTKVVAVSVSENGLVSDAVYGGYTIGNVVEEVQLSDPVIDGYVREMLEKGAKEPIMSDELWQITELELPEGVTDLNDLLRFAGLERLSIHDTAGLDFSVIGNLSTLQALDLSGCTLSASVLDVVSLLPDLKELRLAGCAISSINPLVALTDLEVLDLTNNTISDLTVLSGLTNLRELHLTNNPIKSVAYLNNCLNLEKLYIENCGVAKLSGIAGNKSLQELYAANNEIEDLWVLEDCESLAVLDVANNRVADLSVLTSFPMLREVIANDNQITAVPALDADLPLWNLNLNQNQIEDVSGLAGMKFLNYLYLDYNKVTSLAPLIDCATLTQIEAWDNPLVLEELPPMQEKGIIIHYNPNYEPPAEETPQQ